MQGQLNAGLAALKKCKDAKLMMQQINKDIKQAAAQIETGSINSGSILNELNDAFTTKKTDAEIKMMVKKASTRPLR